MAKQEELIKDYVENFIKDGFCVVPSLFPVEKIDAWNQAFLPLLHQHIEREGHKLNRGPGRFYVTLPFEGIFADPEIYENDTVLSIVEQLVGEDGVLCQLATDTPLKGSEYQDIHRDTPPLFPEIKQETPSFQLAVNFPLVDVTEENGPIEVARGTHMMTRQEGLQRMEAGEIKLEPIFMKKGDVMVRDVRGLHRGTPNREGTPRPTVVIGYSRRWLFRPEVNIRIPRATYNGLSDRAKFWLRFNPVVESLKDNAEENYQSFAF